MLLLAGTTVHVRHLSFTSLSSNVIATSLNPDQVQKIQTEWETVKTLIRLDLGIHCCRGFESLTFKDGGSTIEHADANGTVMPAKSDSGVMLSGT